MASTAAELKAKYQQRRNEQSQSTSVESSPTITIQDRGIKGTLLDDYFAIFLLKFGVPLLIICLVGIIYLGIERMIGAKVITPIRIWGLTAILYGFMCWKNLKIGIGGWIAVFSVSISTAGYLWQFLDTWVGKR